MRAIDIIYDAGGKEALVDFLEKYYNNPVDSLSVVSRDRQVQKWILETNRTPPPKLYKWDWYIIEGDDDKLGKMVYLRGIVGNLLHIEYRNYHEPKIFRLVKIIIQGMQKDNIDIISVEYLYRKSRKNPIYDDIVLESTRHFSKRTSEKGYGFLGNGGHYTQQGTDNSQSGVSDMTIEDKILNIPAMKQHYKYYSPGTAKKILDAIPIAWYKKIPEVGRWGPGLIHEYCMVVSAATIGRYLKAFRLAGIIEIDGQYGDKILLPKQPHS